MLTDRDRGRYHQEASALLARNPWADEDVDYAVRLHDLLEAPDDASPDPIARQLRTRLIKEFDRVLATADNPAYRVRREFFAQSLLDAPDPLRRRLFLLFYRGVASFTGYQGGPQGELQVAIDAYPQLDRLVQAEGSRAADALGGIYGTALLGLAAACYIRYNSRRELLQMDLSPELEREIRADLDLSIEASERTLELSGNPATRASALSALGSAYAFLYEDDKRYNKRATIKKAISLLREAVQLAEAAVSEDRGAIAAIYNLRGVRDRLAAALAIRDRPQDVGEAISLLLKNQAEAAPHGLGQTAGEAASLATAYLRRYLHTGEDADRQRAYEAYSRAFVIAESEHLPEAFTVAAQWGGLAWKQSRWADAGAAYQRATRVMHLAVRQQGSRADREWVVRKAPGVAARAALGLTRSGAVDEAMVTLETGRAVLLTEIFDRRAVDHQRIESLAGKALADDYQRLTDELTGFEAQLLIAGPEGEPAVAAAVEQARRQRSALRARLPAAARNTLTELDGPPTVAELHRAAGRATVVYLDTTSEGGLALILRPGQAPGG